VASTSPSRASATLQCLLQLVAARGSAARPRGGRVVVFVQRRLDQGSSRGARPSLWQPTTIVPQTHRNQEMLAADRMVTRLLSLLYGEHQHLLGVVVQQAEQRFRVAQVSWHVPPRWTCRNVGRPRRSTNTTSHHVTRRNQSVASFERPTICRYPATPDSSSESGDRWLRPARSPRPGRTRAISGAPRDPVPRRCPEHNSNSARQARLPALPQVMARRQVARYPRRKSAGRFGMPCDRMLPCKPKARP
jgi:hypothetical protein